MRNKVQAKVASQVAEIKYQLERLTEEVESHSARIDFESGSSSIQVPSESYAGVEYTVSRVVRFFCTCPDFVNRGGYQGLHMCKHIDNAVDGGLMGF